MAPPHGQDWARFCARHLGDWDGRCVVVVASTGALEGVHEYQLTSKGVSMSKSNPSSALINYALSDGRILTLRYDVRNFHVFADGSYTADHYVLDLSAVTGLPTATPFAVEAALPLSASERVRAFLLYDDTRALTHIALLEEAVGGLFDTRAPLSLTALVGEWRGPRETFRHSSTRGFGDASPTTRARTPYSEEDLPRQLKDPSGAPDGTLRTQGAVRWGWDPVADTVRRATVVSDMRGKVLQNLTLYGRREALPGAMFDVVRFGGAGDPDESVLLALNNGCYVQAPLRRARGVPAAAELCCLVTPAFRRCVKRVYGREGVASETLSSESMTM